MKENWQGLSPGPGGWSFWVFVSCPEINHRARFCYPGLGNRCHEIGEQLSSHHVGVLGALPPASFPFPSFHVKGFTQEEKWVHVWCHTASSQVGPPAHICQMLEHKHCLLGLIASHVTTSLLPLPPPFNLFLNLGESLFLGKKVINLIWTKNNIFCYERICNVWKECSL